MSNTIKPVDNAMLTKIGDKIGSAKEALSTSGAHRVDSQPSGGTAAKSETVKLTSGAQLLERLEKNLASLGFFTASTKRARDSSSALR